MSQDSLNVRKAYSKLADAVLCSALNDWYDLVNNRITPCVATNTTTELMKKFFFESWECEMYCALVDVSPDWIRKYVKQLELNSKRRNENDRYKHCNYDRKSY